MPDFLAWQRPAVHAMATEPPVGPRLAGKLPITLHDGDGVDVLAAPPFLLAGPADVARLTAGQVIGRQPHPGRVDAELPLMPFVELAAADLPWRYSPVPFVAAGESVRPWLVLVVGFPSEVQRLPDGRVALSGADLFAGHPLSTPFLWAHVHQTAGGKISRIISARTLAPDKDYVAALVPGWQAQIAADGSGVLTDSWPTATGSVTLPCFDSWTFHTTADAGDFASISQRLEPLSPADDALLTARQFGRARVGVGPLPDVTLATGGALTVIPEPGSPPIADALPQNVSDAVEALSADLDHDGRWVLTLPRYDAPWFPAPVDGQPWSWPPPADDVVPDGWRRQLRTDPRHRGAAGLGEWIGIAWQDKISDGATRQAGAVAAAAQRIRHLVFGLRGSASLWNRRVPADPLARLATLSPLLGRMPAATGGSALQAIGGRTPTLAPALFSSAARRMLRRRGPLARSATTGATSLGTLVATANRCPDLPTLSDRDEKIGEFLTGDPASIADALRPENMSSILRDLYLSQGQNVDHAAAHAEGLDLDHLPESLVDVIGQRPPDPQCRPLSDIAAFAESVAAGVDPTAKRPVVVDRVLNSITGLREPFLAEPDLAPEIDIPLWSFVKDSAPDWLLPGAGDIPPDRVLAVQSNPQFIDALLLGANYQTLGELRWRNIPITARWTPLRRFWQRIDTGGGVTATDIRSVIALDTDQPLWPEGSDLGDVSHLSDPRQGASLVVVLHTELFRRYPATLVYIAPDMGVPAPWGEVPKIDEIQGIGDPQINGVPRVGDPKVPREYPSFSGTLNPDLVFFGFDVPPEAANDHWVVLEEPPPGPRFLRPGEPEPNPGLVAPRVVDARNAATFAGSTFLPPVRVFLGNLL